MLRTAFSLLLLCLSLTGCGLLRDEGEQEGLPKIEMAVFDGGYGTAWHRKTVDKFLELRRNEGRPLIVDFWGDPRVLDKVYPRVLRGAPPDMSDAQMPFWKLVTRDVLMPMDSWLDGPSADTPGKTWRETFLPGALSSFTCEEKVYGIPLVYNAWLIWYDATLFESHGWKPPRTFSEWNSLCEKIQRAGIAPIAFQGKYAQYADAIFWGTLQRQAGIQAVENCQNFVPGAFLNPEVIDAAGVLQNLARKYFQKGSLTMSHTEAQMEFCNRHAAMIPCGLWLENEMRNAFPPDFRLSCFKLPAMEGGKGNPNAIFALGWQAFLVYRQGGNPEGAAELLRFMLSRENGREWVKTVSTISSIQGATLREDISPGLAQALDIIEHADFTYNNRLYDLFTTWRAEVWLPLLDSLMAGRITPREFGRRAEDSMERVRQDPAVYKPGPRPLPDGAEKESPL